MMKRLTTFVLLTSFLFLFGCDGNHSQPDSNQQTVVVNNLTFPETADELKQQTETILLELEQDIALIESEAFPSFATTISPLNDLLCLLSDTMNINELLFLTSPDKELRDAGLDGFLQFQAKETEIYQNQALFQAVELIATTVPLSDPGELALVANIKHKFIRHGAALDESQRIIFAQQDNRIDVLCSQFQSNVYTESAEWIKENNPPILEEIVQLRTRIANLLGYDSHADLKFTTRMVGSTAQAFNFLNNLSNQIEDAANTELAPLLELKREETSDPEALINASELGYYKKLLSLTLTQDLPTFQPIFTMDAALNGLFDLCENLLTIRIIEQQPELNNIWQQDVKYYLVKDASSGMDLGSFYLDLYPRDDKYNWYATAPLIRGNTYADGHQQLPIAAIIGNFNPAAQLSHREVEILFHEFGHLLHMLLYETNYGLLASSEVPMDFIEVPSTLLQHAASDADVLTAMATNEENVSFEVLRSQIQQFLSTDTKLSPLATQNTIAKSIYDLELHSQFTAGESINVVELGNEIAREYFLPYPDGSAWASSFTYVVAGYDVNYYGYLWSEAIVADLVSVFNDSVEGFYDADIGLKLRQEIFAPGASRDVNESVRQFLDRDWNIDAYMQMIDEL